MDDILTGWMFWCANISGGVLTVVSRLFQIVVAAHSWWLLLLLLLLPNYEGVAQIQIFALSISKASTHRRNEAGQVKTNTQNTRIVEMKIRHSYKTYVNKLLYWCTSYSKQVWPKRAWIYRKKNKNDFRVSAWSWITKGVGNLVSCVLWACANVCVCVLSSLASSQLLTGSPQRFLCVTSWIVCSF